MADPRIHDFMDFVERSPTSWHAVEQTSTALKAGGFLPLTEESAWSLQAGGAYYVVRGGSICAFVVPTEPIQAVHAVGAHTDSPGLKLKPNAEYTVENMTMFGVEVYGGPLLSSWLNRDLAVAGLVAYLDKSDTLRETLVHLTDNPVVVPQLAIHLDRKVNEEGLKLNKQDHMAALAAIDHEGPYLTPLLNAAIPDCKQILSQDLFLAPLERPTLIGGEKKLLSTWRVDNLGSVHAALTALLNRAKPDRDTLKMIVFWDHEEVGSQTAEGAASPFFSDTLERICLQLKIDREEQLRLLSRSLSLSVDAAHGLHPNYQKAHEPRHQPLMGGGVTLKVNAQQRYATTASSSAHLERICSNLGLNLQRFVNRTDMACGSTIGPIHSSKTGIATVDLGYPQLSMHSTRELAAADDHLSLCSLLEGFFTTN